MNNPGLAVGTKMDFVKCPVCGNLTIYSMGNKAVCDECESGFVWFKEDKNKNVLIADPFYEYAPNVGDLRDDQRQIYCGKWINFYNNCCRWYKESVKGYTTAKQLYGEACMIYKGV